MDSVSVASKAGDDQLKIILHIEEGIGLNQAGAVMVSAALSGNKLDSDSVKPGHTTLIDCDLIWETDRKAIRRMKTENLPVKIDCYEVRNVKGDESKIHIGYILIPVKIIPIVPLAKAFQIQSKPRWAKLIGLSKDWRPFKPELLMSIMITDTDFQPADKLDVLEAHGLDSGDSIVIEENPLPSMLTSQKGIFVRLLQREGLVQVGNIDTNCDVFSVTILMKAFRFLENLVPPGDQFKVNYLLWGAPHTTPLLEKKFNRTHKLREKVTIKFRSSLAMLREFFDKIFHIPFELLSGDLLVGSAELKLCELITATTNLQEFIQKYPSLVCEIDRVCPLKTLQPTASDASCPLMDYKIAIEYVATKKLYQAELLDQYKQQQTIDAQAGGDQKESNIAGEQKTNEPTKPKVLSDIMEIQSESNISGQLIENNSSAKQRRNHDVPALDETYTYKIIEELEEWKSKMQETFIVDLKKKENQLLQKLKLKWDQKTGELENDLVLKADKMSSLAKTLEEAHNQLKAKDNKYSRDVNEIQNMKKDLEQAYHCQLVGIRERARQLEDELRHELKLKEIRFADIERCNQHLTRENCELRQRTECLQAELHDLKSNLVPKAEVEKLLQEMRLQSEKCEALQQSKLFYKSEWAKAFRENHKMRREMIENNKEDIFNSRYERICNILSDEQYELKFEEGELDEIKRSLSMSDDEHILY